MWPKTLMGSRGSPADKEKIDSSEAGLQILGQSFYTKWGENISMDSWTMSNVNKRGNIFKNLFQWQYSTISLRSHLS